MGRGPVRRAATVAMRRATVGVPLAAAAAVLIVPGSAVAQSTPPFTVEGLHADFVAPVTGYTVEVSGIDPDDLDFLWTTEPAELCGEWSADGRFATWSHPHPPCPEEEFHPATIRVTISGPGGFAAEGVYPNGSAPGYVAIQATGGGEAPRDPSDGATPEPVDEASQDGMGDDGAPADDADDADADNADGGGADPDEPRPAGEGEEGGDPDPPVPMPIPAVLVAGAAGAAVANRPGGRSTDRDAADDDGGEPTGSSTDPEKFAEGLDIVMGSGPGGWFQTVATAVVVTPFIFAGGAIGELAVAPVRPLIHLAGEEQPPSVLMETLSAIGDMWSAVWGG